MGTRAPPSPMSLIAGIADLIAIFVPNYRCGAVPEWLQSVTGFPF